jgi:hypothetical protein
MPDRVVMGRHPSYPYTGVFISTPGSDVAAQDPTKKPGLVLSSQWPVVANVIASGTCTQGQAVPYPSAAAGMRPYVHFHRLIGSGYNPHEMYGYYVWASADMVIEYEKCSRWKVVHGGSSFTILPNARLWADPITGATFRYTLFNLPVS